MDSLPARRPRRAPRRSGRRRVRARHDHGRRAGRPCGSPRHSEHGAGDAGLAGASGDLGDHSGHAGSSAKAIARPDSAPTIRPLRPGTPDGHICAARSRSVPRIHCRAASTSVGWGGRRRRPAGRCRIRNARTAPRPDRRAHAGAAASGTPACGRRCASARPRFSRAARSVAYLAASNVHGARWPPSLRRDAPPRRRRRARAAAPPADRAGPRSPARSGSDDGHVVEQPEDLRASFGSGMPTVAKYSHSRSSVSAGSSTATASSIARPARPTCWYIATGDDGLPTWMQNARSALS